MSNTIPEMEVIYDSLIRIAKAISSVLNVDVLIVDEKYNRIVATGKSSEYQGQKIDDESVFAYALKSGESFIIDNPRTHVACKSCKNKDSCVEFAEVCCPIILNGKTVGVIGLIAFDELQKQKLLDNKDNILSFLNRMSELIATKMVETRKTNQIIRMAEEMTALFDSIDKGVISLDEDGYILRFNDKAKNLFQLNNEKNKHIKKIIGYENYQSLLKENYVNNASVYGKKEIRILYSARPFFAEKKSAGYVLLFEEIEGVIETYNKIVNSNAETNFIDIIGDSKKLNLVKKEAKKASMSTSTILIQGESGTGKELFARAIHEYSKRKEESFIPINCAAIPENLLESELFGYDEGAFTGARKGGRIGKFELANRGTLFLDEIGDMSLHLQSKLLRVLQDGKIDRLGGKKTISVDVRIVAATNKKLEEKVKSGEFREDLYYRLNVIPLLIPPLRERKEDIEVLADHFLKITNDKINKSILGFEIKVINNLRKYSWPGNVRELENAIEYAVNMTSGTSIIIDDLPERLRKLDLNVSYREEVLPLALLELQEIEKAIKIYGKTKKGIEEAAKALGISRATIYRKIKK